MSSKASPAVAARNPTISPGQIAGLRAQWAFIVPIIEAAADG
jgi:hypothetical protein